MPKKYRELVESERFKTERAELNPSVQRWDEIMHILTWALSNAAEEIGRETDNSEILAVPTDEWPGAAPLVIYFSLTEDQVILESVVEADLPED